MTGRFRNPWAADTSKLRLTARKADGLIGLGGSLGGSGQPICPSGGMAWAPARPPLADWADLVIASPDSLRMIKGFFRFFLAALS